MTHTTAPQHSAAGFFSDWELMNMKLETRKADAHTFQIGFEHMSGGDSKLPKEDRGFFGGYTVRVARTEAEAELAAHRHRYDGEDEEDSLKMAACAIGESKMREMVTTDFPQWVDAAIDDLAAEVC